MQGQTRKSGDGEDARSLREEIEALRRVTYEHHWRLQCLEASLRKRTVVSEARAALAVAGRAARTPGCESRSQYGEDGVLWEIFGGRTEGVFVEAGAIDGLSLSVSAIFEAVGWSGVLVEPVAEQAAACRRNRPASAVVEAALGAPGHPATTRFVHVEGAPEFSGIAPDDTHLELARDQGGAAREIEAAMVTLDEALEGALGEAFGRGGAGSDAAIDFVSLDLEGGELDALRGFDLARWRPRVLVIEDHDRSEGSPTAAWMRGRGYTLAGTLRINRFYVRDDEPELLANASRVHWL